MTEPFDMHMPFGTVILRSSMLSTGFPEAWSRSVSMRETYRSVSTPIRSCGCDDDMGTCLSGEYASSFLGLSMILRTMCRANPLTAPCSV